MLDTLFPFATGSTFSLAGYVCLPVASVSWSATAQINDSKTKKKIDNLDVSLTPLDSDFLSLLVGTQNEGATHSLIVSKDSIETAGWPSIQQAITDIRFSDGGSPSLVRYTPKITFQLIRPETS